MATSILFSIVCFNAVICSWSSWVPWICLVCFLMDCTQLWHDHRTSFLDMTVRSLFLNLAHDAQVHRLQKLHCITNVFDFIASHVLLHCMHSCCWPLTSWLGLVSPFPLFWSPSWAAVASLTTSDSGGFPPESPLRRPTRAANFVLGLVITLVCNLAVVLTNKPAKLQ